jgi:hypothetical protein
MELIDGKNMESYIQENIKSKTEIPIKTVAAIGRQLV